MKWNFNLKTVKFYSVATVIDKVKGLNSYKVKGRLHCDKVDYF